MPSLAEQHRSDIQIATDRRLEGAPTGKATSTAEIANPSASPAPAKTDEYDPRATARGVVVGLLIGIVLWVVIGFAAWYLL
jgi:hypothetical protein